MMAQPIPFIVLASFLVLANSLPHSLDHNEEDINDSKIIVVSPNYLRQAAPVGGVLGALGTALVPVVGAVIGPVLTNLVAGITQAFNNGVNSLNNNTSTTSTTSKPTRPNRRPNRRPSRPSYPHLLDIPTDGLPEFEGFMIRLPGVNHPYLLLAPPGSDLSDLPFKLQGGLSEEERLTLNTQTDGVEGQVTAAETSELYEQPASPESGPERSPNKLKRSGYFFK